MVSRCSQLSSHRGPSHFPLEGSVSSVMFGMTCWCTMLLKDLGWQVGSSCMRPVFICLWCRIWRVLVYSFPEAIHSFVPYNEIATIVRNIFLTLPERVLDKMNTSFYPENVWFLEFLIASKPNVTKLASTSSCFKSFCWKFEIRWLFVIYFNLVCYTLKWGRSVQCDSCDVQHLGLGGGNSSGIILNRAKINLILLRAVALCF